MRYRIISKLVDGRNRFYCQKEKSWFGIKQWVTFDWHFNLSYAEDDIKKKLNPEKLEPFCKIYENKPKEK